MELPSTKRRRSNGSEGMYCYYKEQLFNFKFLDDYSDASTMELQDTDANVLTQISKVEEGINIYKFLIL